MLGPMSIIRYPVHQASSDIRSEEFPRFPVRAATEIEPVHIPTALITRGGFLRAIVAAPVVHASVRASVEYQLVIPAPPREDGMKSSHL